MMSANSVVTTPLTGDHVAKVFHFRKLVPDMRITVFGTELHVHAMILSMYLNFFQKYLDDVGGSSSGMPLTSEFKYEMSLPLLEDRGLMGPRFPYYIIADPDSEELEDQVKMQKTAFANLIRAMYGMPYTFDDASQLVITTCVAKHFGARPILSRSIHQAILESRSINIKGNIAILIKAACSLRSAALFRNCVIWASGWWPKNEKEFFDSIKSLDPKVRRVITAALAQIYALIASAQSDVVKFSQRQTTGELTEMENLYSNSNLPGCYRKLSTLCMQPDTSDLAAALRLLLKNNLAFDKEDWFPGCSPHSNYFVCAWIEDEDLPWDVKEKEWRLGKASSGAGASVVRACEGNCCWPRSFECA